MTNWWDDIPDDCTERPNGRHILMWWSSGGGCFGVACEACSVEWIDPERDQA